RLLCTLAGGDADSGRAMPGADAASRRCAMAQLVRCPRCGGDQGRQGAVRLHARRGVPVSTSGQQGRYLGGGLVAVGGVVLSVLLVLSVVPGQVRQAPGQAAPLVLLVSALLSLAGVVLVVSARARVLRATAETTYRHDYRCQLHDFQWTWREDQPYPYP